MFVLTQAGSGGANAGVRLHRQNGIRRLAVALTGYYPTKSCIRYVKKNDKEEYTVSLENFQLRQSSPPEAEAVTRLPIQIQ